VILLVICVLRYIWGKGFSLNADIKVLPGNTISTLLKPLSSRNQTRLKVYIKTHHTDFSQLEPGTYSFSGHYSKSQFIKSILAGPSNKYIKITVLE
jgi:cell division protein YceG involved in septum cleavage